MRGTTAIAERVVATIAAIATREVEGVHALGEASLAGRIGDALEDAQEITKGVRVEVGKEEASVALTLSVVYGYRIPEVADRVRQNVARALRERCGLTTKAVNIYVVGVQLRESVAAGDKKTERR